MKVKQILNEELSGARLNEIVSWIQKLPSKSTRLAAYVDPNGIIHCENNFYLAANSLRGKGVERGIPYKLGVMGKDFIADAIGLKNFVNFPDKVGGNLLVNGNTEITSLDGITKKIGMILHLDSTGLKSLSGVNKQIESIGRPGSGGIIVLPADMEGNLLGLLLIKFLKTVKSMDNETKPAEHAFKIVTKHLQSERDVLDCQEELIKAGLKEFAKL